MEETVPLVLTVRFRGRQRVIAASRHDSIDDITALLSAVFLGQPRGAPALKPVGFATASGAFLSLADAVAILEPLSNSGDPVQLLVALEPSGGTGACAAPCSHCVL